MTPIRFAKAMWTVAAVAVLAGMLVKSSRVNADHSYGHSSRRSFASAEIAAASQNSRGKNQKLVPDSVRSSTLRVRLDLVGRMPSSTNATSPAIAGSQLLLIDQWGHLDAWDGTSSHLLLSSANLPTGISPTSTQALQNVAANATGTIVYVIFTSSTVPSGIPQLVSPRPGADAWQVLYQYDFNGTVLSNPRAITALQVRTDNHTSGGLTVLGDGTLLFATGDNGFPGEDGFNYPQDSANHLGKILRINTTDGATQIVALGVRNVQRLVIDPNGGDAHLIFADLGGWLAEEVNGIRLTDLLAGGSTQNFGWGRNIGDGKAREGTFYIDPTGTAVGVAPTPELGFVHPLAQFGRQNAPAIAVSGPVISPQSFDRIRSVFGDLVGGSVYAITGAPSLTGQTVFRVGLVDSTLQTVTLKGLAGGNRPDPRFFNFPDGTAGVLLEATGDFFRLTEVR
jgi:Glucose / Sorbosone dehydrogenase